MLLNQILDKGEEGGNQTGNRCSRGEHGWHVEEDISVAAGWGWVLPPEGGVEILPEWDADVLEEERKILRSLDDEVV